MTSAAAAAVQTVRALVIERVERFGGAWRVVLTAEDFARLRDALHDLSAIDERESATIREFLAGFYPQGYPATHPKPPTIDVVVGVPMPTPRFS